MRTFLDDVADPPRELCEALLVWARGYAGGGLVRDDVALEFAAALFRSLAKEASEGAWRTCWTVDATEGA